MPKVLNPTEAAKTVFGNLNLDPADLSFGDDTELDLGPEEGGEEEEGLDLEGDEGTDGPTEDEAPDDRGQEEEPALFSREAEEHRQERRRDEEPRSVTHTDGQLRYDRAGNVVDNKGKVIAQAGRERRLYETAHNGRLDLARERVANNTLRENVKKAVDIATALHTRLQAAQNQPDIARELGVTREEQVEALQLAALSKKSPEEAVKKVLTMAVARGIDLTKLGLTPGVDAKSLMEMVTTAIDKRMTPLTERSAREAELEKRRAEQQGITDDVTRTTQEFFYQNPRALPYVKAIQTFYEQNPRFQNMSLGEVWSRMQLAMLQQRQQPGRRNNPVSRSRMLTGRRGAPSNDQRSDVDKDYGELLNEIMSDPRVMNARSRRG